MSKPSVKFVVNFLFSSDNAYMDMPFFKSESFDHAYMQHKADLATNSDVAFEIGKSKDHYNEADKVKFAKQVISTY